VVSKTRGRETLALPELSLSQAKNDSLRKPVGENPRQENKLCMDLCSGKGGFSQAFVQAGWQVITVDIEAKFKPTVIADITKIDWEQFKRDYLHDESPDVLLESPPCERFSIACPQWPKLGIKKAMEIVGACLEAVVILKPKYWLLENPRGRLRWFLGKPGKTIRYSDYDLETKAEKLTDFWGNIPLPMVKHERFLNVGHVEKHWFATYVSTSPSERAKIPLGVSQAVLQGVETSMEKVTATEPFCLKQNGSSKNMCCSGQPQNGKWPIKCLQCSRFVP